MGVQRDRSADAADPGRLQVLDARRGQLDGGHGDRRVVDDNGGGCAQPYTLRTPCAGSVTASYGFDTTQLSDGPHTVQLAVRDATETNQVAYGPVHVTVDNTPAPALPTPAPDVR